MSARPSSSPPPPASADPGDDERPGVPLFQTWRGVYAFVFASFLLVVLLLTIFTHVYA
ncbi:MAG TPA: hypothetical protein VEA63_05910 [Opitutus sp.]|nr:hypothetical protein [Opitutus sp.]